MRRSSSFLALVVLLALAADTAGGRVASDRTSATPTDFSVGPRAVVGENIKHPDYRGSFGAVETGERGELLIKIKARDRQGYPRTGLFQAESIPVRCFASDGTVGWMEYRLRPLVAYFHRRGKVFDGYDYSDSQNFEMVITFEGEMIRGGKAAEGTIYILANPFGADNRPTCTTQGTRIWTAQRVGES